ncbi:hypothetical protein A5777_16500 [Gordonia sp. 852002-10350_SCH5691597]|nr:hypothetical protein A5777_16500 [Gordonia sp. 852002-10350_SCH5691597]
MSTWDFPAAGRDRAAPQGLGSRGAQRPLAAPREPDRREGGMQAARSADCMTAWMLAGASTSGAAAPVLR